MSYKQKSPLPVAEGGTNTSSFPFDHGVLVFEAGQQISINPGLVNHVLTSNGPALPPTFQPNGGSGSGITILNADVGSATGSTVTIFGGNNINTFASAASLTVELVNSPNVVGSITAGAGLIATTLGLTVTSGGIVSSGITNINTAAADFATSIGNLTGSSAMVLRAGTGSLALSTASTGDITLNSSDTVLIDSVGVLELNSSAGVISIGNDAVAQNINIGTGAAQRIVTIGNVSSATAVNVNTGTAGTTYTTTNGIFTLNTGTGAISIGGDAVQKSITIGNATGTTGINLTTGSTGTVFTGFAEGALLTSSTGKVSTATGTAGFILTANAAGSSPTFQAPAASSISITGNTGGALTGAAFTFSGGTTGLSFGGSGSTETLTGVVVLANGGTNANLTASNGGIFYSTATAGAILGGTATARQMLQSGSSTTPAWSTTTWPATTTANQLLYSSATSVVGEVASGAFGVLISDTSSVPSWLANGTTGQILTATTSGTASWQTPAVQGFTWNNVTGTTQAMAVGNGYIGNDGATLVTMTLPVTASVGQVVGVQGSGTGLITVAQNANQQIHFNGVDSTIGVGGSVSTTSRYDALTLICIATNNDWVVNTSMGTLNVV